jgi:signal transduction histidine kinase
MGGSLAQQPEDFSISVVNGHHYRMLRVQGARTVDPLEPGGGKVHQVVVVYGSPVSHVWRAIRGAVEFYAAGSVLLLLVTGPLIAWLLHRGLLPLRQLASLASQVSVDAWHFSPPASAYSTPELAPLTRALESALHRLERSFLQQRAFVSDAAHELKTAVAVAKSSIQLLTIKRRTPEEYEAGLERCLVDSHRLENLVVEMLTLARAESAAPEASGEPTADLVACMRVAVMKLETISALRDVHVSLIDLAAEASPSQIKVRAAEDDCKMLVSNLLLNALQHSPSASTVDLKLTCEAGEGASSAVSSAVFVVRDRGSGIAPEALPHVFDRFYRGDPSRTRNTGGTGLGLAISKAIVQKAGGSITITSQADPKLPHQGTTVTVRLPMIE